MNSYHWHPNTSIRSTIIKSRWLRWTLTYQPLISLTENKILGFEALIRWRHPELGLVPPDKFICHAEESHLIIPIGNWVIESACQQIIEWRQKGLFVDKTSYQPPCSIQHRSDLLSGLYLYLLVWLNLRSKNQVIEARDSLVSMAKSWIDCGLATP